MAKQQSDLTVASTFVWRAPLLPLSAFTGWSTGADASVDDLRAHLRDLVATPAVRDAVFVASPDLDDSLEHWLSDPDSPRGQKVERSLVRYVSRMAGRATPFGMFSGVATGTVADATSLPLPARERYERYTRLDNDYLFALTEALGKDPSVRAQLRYRPNSSLYSASGRLRYAEARLDNKLRTYHLVAVEPSDYLLRTLERARDGAARADLAAALVADDPDIDLDEAEEFVDELIDAQLLITDVSPAVTGREPIIGVIDELRSREAAPAAADALAAARDAIAAIDRGGVGAPSSAYRDIASRLAPLPAKVELSRLFQIDMVVPTPDATIGPRIIAEVQRAIDVLRRIGPRRSGDSLQTFRDAFRERYEDREVPLVEALDEEAGIGFQASNAPEADASPLLAGLAFGGRAGAQQVNLAARDVHLMRRVFDVVASGARELVLTSKDIDAMSSEPQEALPDGLSTMVTVAAASAEDVDRGRFTLYLTGASGPSGANLSGRFCHASESIHAAVREQLRAEEAARPHAVFAEIAHLPEGRIGNILCRPVLRDYEIPYLGVSGAPRDRQIPVQDLMVSVVGGRVVLRSRSLDREVVPRLTTAHNFSLRSLGMYRFLCSLQYQGVSGAGWDWGPVGQAKYLPRVRYGKLVFSRAQWVLDKTDLEPIAEATRGEKKLKTAEQIRDARAKVVDAVRGVQARHGLPRYCVVADGDNELPVDFDNELSVDSFARLVRNRGVVTLHELYPGPDELVAEGPDGRFTHQLVVSLTRPPAEAEDADAAKPTPAARPRPTSPAPYRFTPGSEWLYTKVYCGSATGDDVLCELAPVIRDAIGNGAADQWFFIRYADPREHLRLRFRGAPGHLCERVLPQLSAALAPAIDSGRVWRVQLDTYDRESERYGGPAGIELAERLFHADSDAVLGIVELLEGDAGADARWRLALRGADRILEDAGYDLEGKLRIMRRARESFGREFSVGKHMGKQLGNKYRAELASIEALVVRDPARDEASELAPGFEILEQRSQVWRPVFDELRARDGRGELAPTLEEVVWSYIHMHVNRLLRSAQRAQELVLYDFLNRFYESQRARR